MVGAFGGIGGFLLPTLLGETKQSWGSFAAGFVVLAAIAAGALLALRALLAARHGWRGSWATVSAASGRTRRAA